MPQYCNKKGLQLEYLNGPLGRGIAGRVILKKDLKNKEYEDAGGF
jgi:hypothetical protein